MVDMKADLDKLEQEAMGLIREYANRVDVAALTQLSDAARRITDVKQHLADIDHEYRNIVATLNTFRHRNPADRIKSNGVTTGSHRKKLRIEIDWPKLGKGPAETICENVSSATMVQFVNRMFEKFGEPVLEKLARLRLNRGPFLSKSPEVDFSNKAAGTLYQHQSIPGTEYYVLTHSANVEKVADIRRAVQQLGIPAGIVTVTEVLKGS
jgi:hypothetical protein